MQRPSPLYMGSFCVIVGIDSSKAFHRRYEMMISCDPHLLSEELVLRPGPPGRLQ